MVYYSESFSWLIVSGLLLHHGVANGMGILRTASSSESIEDNEIEANFGGSGTCEKELKSVLARLETLELEFQEYKKTEDDRHFYVTSRTNLIAKELIKLRPLGKGHNSNQILTQAKFIQKNIMDPKLLEQIAEKIWTAVLSLPEITTKKLFAVFENIFQSSPSLYVPMYEYLFDYLHASGELPQNLTKLIQYLKEMLEKSNTVPSIAWTDEFQEKIIQRIFSNVANWSDTFKFTSSGFFNSFPGLSELETYTIAFNAIEKNSELSVLTTEELKFVKKICVVSSICSDESLYGDEASMNAFLAPKIRASIKNEIFSQVRSNLTDVSSIALKYFASWNHQLNEIKVPENVTSLRKDNGQSDILRSFAVDLFLDAISKGEMTFDSSDPNFLNSLQIFGRSRKVVENYPLFTQEFSSIVVRKFRHNYTNFESIREFLESVDKVSVPVEVWKFFVDSMKENHRLNGNEAFQLGELLSEALRNGDPIWDELPLPIKLLFNSGGAGFKWRVKVQGDKNSDVEFFDIVCAPDHTIGLVPINSTGSYTKIWKFDKFDPWFAYTRLDLGYSEVSGNLVTFTIQAEETSKVGKVILGEKDNDGNRQLTHFPDFVGPERDGSTFNVFKPSLNSNLQVFHLSLLMISEDSPMTVERFLSVLYDSDNRPVGLGVPSTHHVANRKAEFVLSANV